MKDNMASTSVGTDEMLVPAEEVSTPAQGAEITEEERLRQEAAKRLERRRKKMMSPEERLAKITGRPVEPVSPVSEVVSSGETILTPGGAPSASISSSAPVEDDPPLEHLTRDPFTADTPTMEGEFLTSMLGGQAGSSPPSDPVKFSHSIWLFLALAVRLLLETEFSWILGNNMVAPFIVMVSILVTTGYLSIANLQTTSLLTAGEHKL